MATLMTPLPPHIAITRFLTFRLTRQDYLRLERRHLVVALAWTWVVGIGRWWDAADASLLQHTGLGSVAYVCTLSGILWLVVLPLRPHDWTYPRVLTLVAMTAPPGILYAIPVERLFDVRTAGQMNLWFLALVATWRVALLVHFLVRFPLIGWFKSVLCSVLPVTAIVSALAALNLHRVVFNIMGSIAEGDRSAHDGAYQVVVALAALAWLVFPVAALSYLIAVVLARRQPAQR